MGGRPARLPRTAAITLLLILSGAAPMACADSYARALSFPDQDLQLGEGWLGLWPADVPSDTDASHGPPSDRLAYRGDRPQQNARGAWVDRNLQSPRTWYIQDLWHRLRTVTTIVEQENLCLDRYFYWPIWSFTGDLYQDNWYFYSRKSLLTLSASIGGAAALANTSADQQVQDWLQQHVATDHRNWQWAKFFGEPWIIPPLLLTVWAIDQWAPPYGLFREYCWNPELGLWSRQSLRALAVGAHRRVYAAVPDRCFAARGSPLWLALAAVSGQQWCQRSCVCGRGAAAGGSAPHR